MNDCAGALLMTPSGRFISPDEEDEMNHALSEISQAVGSLTSDLRYMKEQNERLENKVDAHAEESKERSANLESRLHTIVIKVDDLLAKERFRKKTMRLIWAALTAIGAVILWTFGRDLQNLAHTAVTGAAQAVAKDVTTDTRHH
jgi:hypothetical protein